MIARGIGHGINAAIGGGLICLVRAYQLLLRPVLGANCRFEPHCSAYAIASIRVHGPWHGSRLTVWRLLRCNPFCAGGHDPVPPHPHKAMIG